MRVAHVPYFQTEALLHPNTQTDYKVNQRTTKMCKVTKMVSLRPRKAVAGVKTPRRVRFGYVQAKVFNSAFSMADKKAIWYCAQDYKAMNKEIHRSLKKELYYGYDPHDMERSWRGLEHIREGVPNVKLERRRSFVRSLLYMHKSQGVRDPEQLGAIAAAHSSIDQLRAQQFADYDAYEASCVYYENKCFPSCFSGTTTEDYKAFTDIPRTKCARPKRTVLTPRPI